MCDNHKGLNVCHLNARSLNSDKIDYLNYMQEGLNINVFCISETWFKMGVDDKYYALEDFRVLRNDRNTGGRGGGIAIYCKNYLQQKLIHASGSAEQAEYMFVEVGSTSSKCLVACVYNPNKRNDLSTLFCKISELSLLYEHVLVCGDFNIDLLQKDLRCEKFIDDISAAGLVIMNQHATRFAPNCKPSLLDLVCVGDFKYVNHNEQLSLAGISDHDLLFLSYNINLRKSDVARELVFRDFKNIDISSLDKGASSTNWESIWFLADVNDKLKHFNMFVNSLFEKHIPLRK